MTMFAPGIGDNERLGDDAGRLDMPESIERGKGVNAEAGVGVDIGSLDGPA